MHPENDLRPGVVYERTRDLDDLPTDLRLPNAAWAVLFAVTGEHTAAQVGEHCGLSAAHRDRAFGALLAHDLLAERPVTAGEYLRAAATLGDETPHDLATFLASVARPRVGGVAMAKRSAPPASEATHSGTLRTVEKPKVDPTGDGPRPTAPTGDVHVTRRISAAEVQRAVETSSEPGDVGFEPLNEPTGEVAAVTPPPSVTVGSKPPPIAPPVSTAPSAPTPPVVMPEAPIPSDDAAEPSKADERRLSLRSLMQFILDRAPDLNAGQLDVYRVFIRVDTKLLKRNGITTLRFEEDRLVGDRELQQAIRSSLERTLGLTMPQTVFV